MRKARALLVIALCALGGCTWVTPAPPRLFPDEIVPGWRLDTEAVLAAEDLPAGTIGGRGAAWKAGEAWIWAEVVTLGSPAAATALFSETVSTFLEYEQDRIGDEGARLVHGPSGLVLHLFRVGPSLAALGSLAGNPARLPRLISSAGPPSLWQPACPTPRQPRPAASRLLRVRPP